MIFLTLFSMLFGIATLMDSRNRLKSNYFETNNSPPTVATYLIMALLQSCKLQQPDQLSQNKYGAIKQYRYGPIQLHTSLQIMKQKIRRTNPKVKAIFYLGKMQKFSGEIYFSRISKEALYIQININNQLIQIQHPLLESWQDYQQLYTLHLYSQNTLNVSLGKDRNRFLQGLKKLKIFVHYYSTLKVTFFSQEDLSTFLLKLLNITESKFEINQNLGQQSLKPTQINNAYKSKDFSEKINPFVCSETLLMEDLKGVVQTRKSGFSQEMKQTQESLVSVDQNRKYNMKKDAPIMTENTKTTTSIKIIKEQENEEENQIRNKTNKHSEKQSEEKSQKQSEMRSGNPPMKKPILKKNHFKSHFPPKKELGNTIKKKSMSPKSKKTQQSLMPPLKRNLSYVSALQRNRYLEFQNRHLMLENIRLKYEIQILKNTIDRRGKKQRKNSEIPFFLKNRTMYQEFEKKKNKKSGKYFRHTQGGEVQQRRERKNSSRSPNTSLSILRSSIYENHSANSIYAQNNSKSFYSTYQK